MADITARTRIADQIIVHSKAREAKEAVAVVAIDRTRGRIRVIGSQIPATVSKTHAIDRIRATSNTTTAARVRRKIMARLKLGRVIWKFRKRDLVFCVRRKIIFSRSLRIFSSPQIRSRKTFYA